MVRPVPVALVNPVCAVRRPLFVRRCPCRMVHVLTPTSPTVQRVTKVHAKAVFVISRITSIQSAKTGIPPQVQDPTSQMVPLVPAVFVSRVSAVRKQPFVRLCPSPTAHVLIRTNPMVQLAV